MTAVDTSANESADSNQDCATTQAGGGPPGILLSWDFAGEGGSSSSTAETIDADISSTSPSGVAEVGPGLTAMNYCGNGLTARGYAETLSEVLAGDDYFTWTITPESGKSMSLSSVDIRPVSQNRTRTFVLYSSVNGFAEGQELGSFDYHGNVNNTVQTVDLTGHDNLTGAVEFRLYVYGVNADGYEAVGMGEGDGDDLTVNGTTQ